MSRISGLDGLRARLSHRKTTVALVAVLVVVTAINAWWIWVRRRGGGLDIDEAGYLGISLNDFHAWQTGGVHALADRLRTETIQPPLEFMLLNLLSAMMQYTAGPLGGVVPQNLS